MKNYIFDCDGTIIDSYPSIADRLHQLFLKHNIDVSIAEIINTCMKHNTYYLLRTITEKHNLKFDDLKQELDSMKEKIELITLIHNADKLLIELTKKGNRCFIYTHRGLTTKTICENLNIDKYFVEIVDSTYNFERKPSSEAIDYLVDKYSLDKNNTYYVGDRTLDLECGINAGVKTIFLKNKTIELDHHLADYVVEDLFDIVNIDE